MDLKEVIFTSSSPQLAHSFDERSAFDISYSPPQLDDADIRFLLRIVHRNPGYPVDPVLNGIGKVRDNLYRLPQIVSSPLFLDDMLIDLASRDVVLPGQGNVQVAFVVAQIQVHLPSVVQNEDLAMPDSDIQHTTPYTHSDFAILSRGHGSRIDIHVWIHLYRGDVDGCQSGSSARRSIHSSSAQSS